MVVHKQGAGMEYCCCKNTYLLGAHSWRIPQQLHGTRVMTRDGVLRNLGSACAGLCRRSNICKVRGEMRCVIRRAAGWRVQETSCFKANTKIAMHCTCRLLNMESWYLGNEGELDC